MEEMQCKVTLLHMTDNYDKLLNKVWEVSKANKTLDEIDNMDLSEVDIPGIANLDLPVSEFINFVWCIENMPRAFWDQLDRYRQAGYWEQGLRILDIRNFASERRYFTPPNIKNDPKLNEIYIKTMDSIEKEYNKLLDNGAAVEDARGIIPLHILTRGTFVINLRNFRRLISTRLCHVCQGTYWNPVISGMLSELKKVLPTSIVSSISKLPCSGKSECPIETNAIVTLEKNAKNLLCPVYLRKYLPEDQRDEARKIMISREPEYDKMCDDYIKIFNLSVDNDN